MSLMIAPEIVAAQFAGVAGKPEMNRCCEKVGIAPMDLQALPHGVSGSDFARLLKYAFAAFDDEALGFTRRPMKAGTFRMMCHATVGCTNLRRALLRVTEFFHLMSDDVVLSLEEQGEEARLHMQLAQDDDPQKGYFYGMLFTIVWRYAAWLIDAPLLLNRVHFSHRPEHPVDIYEGVYACPVYLGQRSNYIVFSNHYLSKSIKQSAETLTQFLADAPQCLLTRYQADDSISGKLKTMLSESENLEHMTLETAAEAFDCSSQSLARKLKKEGHQFQQLKDKVRKNRTITLLLNTDLSISEISYQLGFAEDAVFYRAFKKWTGQTPKAYRDIHR